MKIPTVLDGSYKAGVVYGLQTASFNALRHARKCYSESKLHPQGSVSQQALVSKMKTANHISIQNREAARACWASSE